MGLILNMEKSKVSVRSTEFLGHDISKEGIGSIKSRIEAIGKTPAPKTLTDLRAFLGLAIYYRKWHKLLQKS